MVTGADIIRLEVGTMAPMVPEVLVVAPAGSAGDHEVDDPEDLVEAEDAAVAQEDDNCSCINRVKCGRLRPFL